MPTTATTASDIAAVQKAFAGHNTHAVDVAALPQVGNSRYARELLGLMVREGLASERGEDHYIHPVLATPKPRTTKAAKVVRNTATGTGQACRCGCGEATNKGRSFLPGHDARMVSQFVAWVVSSDKTKATPKAPVGFDRPNGYFDGDDIQNRIDIAADYLERQFSSALAIKFANSAHAHWARVVGNTNHQSGGVVRGKGAKRPAAKVKPVWTVGTPVKVGRWDYPTRQAVGSEPALRQRNTKRDGSGEWIAV